MTSFSGTLVGDDGSTLIVKSATLVDPPLPPPPSPLPTVTPTAVRAGSSTYPVAGVNVPRAADALVVLTGTPPGLTGTNQYGTEVTVQGGKVTRTNDRQATSNPQGTPYVADGYLLSGHGKARDWLLANATQSAAVTLLTTPPVPVPVPTPTPVTGRTIATYLMLWAGTVASIPPGVTQVRLAFAQGTPLRLVGSGGQTMAALRSWVDAFRARGGQVLLSVGGQGGAVSTSDRAGFVAAVRAIEAQVPLDGIDWDIEASALNVADVVAISQALHRPGWVTSFVPSGGPPVALYLDAAVQCSRAGLTVQFSQQFYDSDVSQPAAIDATARAIAAGLPPSSMLVAMMNPPGSVPNGYWDNATCEANMTAIRKRWPDIGGAVLWETNRVGAAEWVTRMAKVLA